MSSTQDLCDGVVTLTESVARFEAAHPGMIDDPAWVQMRRATGYMLTMAAWKEDMEPGEVLEQGCDSPILDSGWEVGRWARRTDRE
jgi:hypothetical protein